MWNLIQTNKLETYTKLMKQSGKYELSNDIKELLSMIA